MKTENIRTGLRWLLASIYLLAGVLHVMRPLPFLTIMPHWVPWPEQVVLFTGLCEIAGGAGLLIPRLRGAAGAMLGLYALCVWPANMQHAINDLSLVAPQLGWGYHAPRLLLQPVIIWWALFAGGNVHWPLGGDR